MANRQRVDLVEWESRFQKRSDACPATLEANSSGPIQGYVLYDRVNKVRIAQKAVGQFTNTPVWSPDGSKFVITRSLATVNSMSSPEMG